MRVHTSSTESAWNPGAFGGSEATAAGMVVLLGLVVLLCICGVIPICCSRSSDGRLRQQRGGVVASSAAGSPGCVDELQLNGQAAGSPAQAIKAVAVPPNVRNSH